MAAKTTVRKGILLEVVMAGLAGALASLINLLLSLKATRWGNALAVESPIDPAERLRLAQFQQVIEFLAPLVLILAAVAFMGLISYRVRSVGKKEIILFALLAVAIQVVLTIPFNLIALSVVGLRPEAEYVIPFLVGLAWGCAWLLTRSIAASSRTRSGHQ